MNIYLNPLSVDDAENALTWVNDPEVTQYFANMQNKISLEEEREYILRLNHSQNDKAWSVFAKAYGQDEMVVFFLQLKKNFKTMVLANK